MKKSYKELLRDINTFVFDVDGVLADNNVILFPGEVLRTMNSRDGYALQFAIKKQYNVCIITGGNSKEVKNRLERFGITDVFLSVSNKLPVFEEYLKNKNISKNQVLYMGDDIPDYQCLEKAGVATCPSNAAEEIKTISDYVSPVVGGRGCARDVIEQTLKVQGKWFDKDAFNW